MQWLDIKSTKSQDLTWKYSKNYEKKFFWIQQGLNWGPSGYGTCMLQKSYGDLLFLMGIFYGTLRK